MKTRLTRRSPDRRDWEPFVEELRGHLLIGDLDRARAQLLETTVDPKTIVAAIPDDGTRRMKAAAVIGEILFAFGDDLDAQAVLKKYAEESSGMLVSSLDARLKLQLAEYYYSRFKADTAYDIATRILEDAQTANRPAEVGECQYYLARYELRRTNYDEASAHSIRGLEVFHQRPGQSRSKAIYWQTGRLLRVRGTALWWRGRLSEATAVLYLSAWVVRESKASTIYVGDALHALGRLLRSLGPERYREAQQALEQACEHYADHHLKRARTLTDLARTLCNTGLRKLKDHDERSAKNYFAESEKRLTEALALTEKHCVGEDPPIVWLRERLDALIWRSWLRQEAGAELNPAGADPFDDATEAMTLAKRIGQRPEYVEAALVYGHAAMTRRKFTDAESHFQEAVDLAEKMGIKKLVFHATLRLAQLACRARRAWQPAEVLYNRAMALGKDDQALRGYLQDVALEVRREIDALVQAVDRFVFTRADLMKAVVPPSKKKEWSRLKVLRAFAEKWALDAALHETKDSVADAAELLGISLGSIREIRLRYDAVSKAQKQDDATTPR